MTVTGALSSFRELGEMSPHERASLAAPEVATPTANSGCEDGHSGKEDRGGCRSTLQCSSRRVLFCVTKILTCALTSHY